MKVKTDHSSDEHLIYERSKLYTKLWGRAPDFVCHQTNSEVPHIDVYRFPKVQHECPMSFRQVYMTAGMSDMEMVVPPKLTKSVPSRVEISAYSDKIITMNGGKLDFISSILHWLAHYTFRESTFLAATQTFQVGHPIIPGSEMSAYYGKAALILAPPRSGLAINLFSFSPPGRRKRVRPQTDPF